MRYSVVFVSISALATIFGQSAALPAADLAPAMVPAGIPGYRSVVAPSETTSRPLKARDNGPDDGAAPFAVEQQQNNNQINATMLQADWWYDEPVDDDSRKKLGAILGTTVPSAVAGSGYLAVMEFCNALERGWVQGEEKAKWVMTTVTNKFPDTRGWFQERISKFPDEFSMSLDESSQAEAETYENALYDRLAEHMVADSMEGAAEEGVGMDEATFTDTVRQYAQYLREFADTGDVKALKSEYNWPEIRSSTQASPAASGDGTSSSELAPGGAAVPPSPPPPPPPAAAPAMAPPAGPEATSGSFSPFDDQPDQPSTAATPEQSSKDDQDKESTTSTSTSTSESTFESSTSSPTPTSTSATSEPTSTSASSTSKSKKQKTKHHTTLETMTKESLSSTTKKHSSKTKKKHSSTSTTSSTSSTSSTTSHKKTTHKPTTTSHTTTSHTSTRTTSTSKSTSTATVADAWFSHKEFFIYGKNWHITDKGGRFYESLKKCGNMKEWHYEDNTKHLQDGKDVPEGGWDFYIHGDFKKWSGQCIKDAVVEAGGPKFVCKEHWGETRCT